MHSAPRMLHFPFGQFSIIASVAGGLFSILSLVDLADSKSHPSCRRSMVVHLDRILVFALERYRGLCWLTDALMFRKYGGPFGQNSSVCSRAIYIVG